MSEPQSIAQSQKPYSVKISATQKCLEVDVHIYGDDGNRVCQEAVDAWLMTTQMLKAKGYVVAPLDGEKR